MESGVLPAGPEGVRSVCFITRQLASVNALCDITLKRIWMLVLDTYIRTVTPCFACLDMTTNRPSSSNNALVSLYSLPIGDHMTTTLEHFLVEETHPSEVTYQSECYGHTNTALLFNDPCTDEDSKTVASQYLLASKVLILSANQGAIDSG